MKLPDTQTVVEQIALLFTSFIWTVVVLAAIIIFWLYQDVQARWDFVLNAPPEALAQAAPPPPPTATPPPTPTLWPGPGPTLTPSPTKPPTPTATWVIPPPNMLPETLNPDDPTPVPVVIPTDVNIEGLEVEPPPPPVPPTATPEPTQSPPQPEQEPVPLPFDTPTPIPVPTATVPVVPPAPPPTAPPPSIPVTDEGIPDRLVIPSVGIDAPIISVGWRVVEQNNQQYSIWDVADYAVGWHKTSARLGQPGNSVMAGHHNINGEVFRDLVNVEVGDRVTVYSAGGAREYVIDLKTIVKEKGEPPEVRQRNAQWIAPTTDERLTLVTCWPYTNNTHRVIVVAKPL